MTTIACIFYLETNICRITYQEIDDKNFEYIFEPFYKAIDKLSNFRGIQGLDLTLRKEKYIRRNQLPSFIYEHNPMPDKIIYHSFHRVSGITLLEYIARSKEQYFGDKLHISME